MSKVSSWPNKALEQHVDLLPGFAFKSNQFTDVPSDVPLVKGADVQQGYIDWDNCKHWPRSLTQDLGKFWLQEGDVILAMDRPWIPSGLKWAWIKRSSPKSLLVQRVARLRGKNGLFTDYLRYLIASPQFTDYIRPIVTGVTVPHISGTQILGFSFYLPPFTTQQRIAAILSAYDDLIENNLRRIKILEEMAQNLYREWFVKFRFPGHQQVRFTDSPLGRIPEQWQVASISDIAIIHRGRSYKGTELADEGGRPFINLKCMERDGGFRSSGLKRYTGLFKDTQTVRAGEMVMAITDMTQERRIVARVGRVSRLDSDFGILSMDLVRAASRGKLSEAYLYAMLRWSGFADEVKQHANGANVLHLLPDQIGEYHFVCPTPDIATRFEEIVLPMLSLSETLEHRNTTLRRTRDLLLPRLISGELDVSDLDVAVTEEPAV
ncbi:restriction endonuclease subunit S [uncultured Thiodictyon sp.]|uniref:restriction endonuclease subunit S n=1 Tax=uncultured Thiodictyon sp. TaxID=1846217 RepID=UPI0025EEA2FB|nr:restriction endonuclease subunit S [uncultured Thiodictyon sp.]